MYQYGECMAVIICIVIQSECPSKGLGLHCVSAANAYLCEAASDLLMKGAMQ